MMGTERNHSRRLRHHVQVQEPSSTTVAGKKHNQRRITTTMCQEEKKQQRTAGKKRSKLPPPLIRVEFSSCLEQRCPNKEGISNVGISTVLVDSPRLGIRSENPVDCAEFEAPWKAGYDGKHFAATDSAVDVTSNNNNNNNNDKNSQQIAFKVASSPSDQSLLQDAKKIKVENGMMVLLEAAQHHSTDDPTSTGTEDCNEEHCMPLYVTVTARCPVIDNTPSALQVRPALPESCDTVSSTVVTPSVIQSTLVIGDDEGPKLGNTLLVSEKKMRAHQVPKAVEMTPASEIFFQSSESTDVTNLSTPATPAFEAPPSWANRPLEDLSLAHAILDLSSPHRIPKNKRHLVLTSSIRGVANDDSADYMDLDATNEERKDMDHHAVSFDNNSSTDSNPGTPNDAAGLMVYTYEEFFMSDGRSKKRVIAEEPREGLQVNGKYKCSECGKFYATSSNLSRHKQTHRSLESGATRQCPTCGKAYVSMPALAMHILTHQLAHKCPICNKGFSRPWLLQGHLRSHTGERPYGCAHCGKAFADRSNLRAHMQMHSNVKSFHCHKCNKAFALKAYLNKHLESSCAKDEVNSTGSSPGSSPEPSADEAKLIASHLDSVADSVN